MSSGRLTGIKLNGREIGLLYTYSNARLAVRMLQQFCPPGNGKLTLGDAGTLLLKADQDAINVFLQAGMQHDPQLKETEPDEIDKWLDKAVRKPEQGGDGRKLAQISRVILEGLKTSGLVDLIYEDKGLKDGETAEGERPIRAVVETAGS